MVIPRAYGVCNGLAPTRHGQDPSQMFLVRLWFRVDNDQLNVVKEYAEKQEKSERSEIRKGQASFLVFPCPLDQCPSLDLESCASRVPFDLPSIPTTSHRTALRRPS